MFVLRPTGAARRAGRRGSAAASRAGSRPTSGGRASTTIDPWYVLTILKDHYREADFLLRRVHLPTRHARVVGIIRAKWRPGVERGHVEAGETVFVLRAKRPARRGFVAPDMAPLGTLSAMSERRDRRDLHAGALVINGLYPASRTRSPPREMSSRFFRIQAATFWPLVRNRGARNQMDA